MKHEFETGSFWLVRKNEPTEFFTRLNNLGITEGCTLYIKAKAGKLLIVTARDTDFAVRRENLSTLSLTEKYENSVDWESKLRKDDTL